MPRRAALGLSLPQTLVDEAEASGGSAGELVSIAPLSAWGSAGIAAAGSNSVSGATSPAATLPPAAGAAGVDGTGRTTTTTTTDNTATTMTTNCMESPRTRVKSRQQLDEFRQRPEAEQVHELATALMREYLAKHAAEVAPVRDAFEAAFPRDERSVNRRSVICSALQCPEPGKTSPESILEALVRRLIAPPPIAPLSSGVFSAQPSSPCDRTRGTSEDEAAPPALGGLAMQNSLYFNMSPDGLGIDVNGLALGTSADATALFRVQDLNEIDLDNAIVIGKGAGGRVLRAKSRRTNEWVAVKEIYLGNDDVIKQIEAEISVLWGTTNRRKNHIPSPFLVNCQGIFYHDGMLYIVMELMDGSLKDALDVHGVFSEDELKGITFQILHGLQYMHFDKCQLHRDIKPHNVLYNRNGWVKLSDFGIASDKMSTAQGHSRQTFCGTLLYMSPSRAEGESYGYEADVWSLGMTLYQMALNKLPVANNLFEVIQLRSNPPRLPADRFSEKCCDFFATCLDPEATAATTVTVRQLLRHPWLVDMTLERSQDIVREVFRDILTRTQRAAAGHKPVGFGQHDDLFATLDQVLE